jgi:branched-chain amino acid transport system ATP-binding protein
MPADGRTGLTVRGLTARDGSRVLVADVDLEVGRGEVLGVVSADRSSSSALLEAIAGLRDREGTVTVDGRDVPGGEPASAALLGVVLGPTGGSTIAGLTVAEHLHVAATAGRGAGGVDLGGVVGRLCATRAEQIAGTLSGGERRLLALAMVARSGRSVVLLDQPSEGIAEALSAEIAAAIRTFAQEAAVIVADSDPRLLDAVVDRVVQLEGGRINASGGLGPIPERSTGAGPEHVVGSS